MPVIYTEHKAILSAAIIILSLITAAVVFQPEGHLFRYFTNYALEILFLTLGVSFVFWIAKWHYSMYYGLFCTGILCLFLKSSTNPNPTYAAPVDDLEETLDIIQVSVDGDYEEFCMNLLESNADIISIQEVTPDWDFFFQEFLVDSFPYFISVPSISFNGLSIYSKLPFLATDTFYYKETPNITGMVSLDDNQKKTIRLLSTYTNPIFTNDLKEHFTKIVEEVKYLNGSLVAMGSFNTVAWSSEMKYFTNELNLVNSKRSVNPFTQGTYEHIFHSQYMECSSFEGFTDTMGNDLGLRVQLQFKNKVNNYDIQETQ